MHESSHMGRMPEGERRGNVRFPPIPDIPQKGSGGSSEGQPRVENILNSRALVAGQMCSREANR